MAIDGFGWLLMVIGGYEWLQVDKDGYGRLWNGKVWLQVVTSGDGKFQVQTLQTNIQTFSNKHTDHHCYDNSRQVIIIFLTTTMVVLARSPYVLGPYLETCYRRRAEPRARKQISGPSPLIISCYDILLLRLRQA